MTVRKNKIQIFLLLGLILSFSQVIRAQITADHTVVDLYDDIPQKWIDSVKTKLFYIHGMSHAYGYLRGFELLSLMDNAYAADIWFETSVPPAQTTAVRVGRPSLGGDNIVTSPDGRSHLEQNVLEAQNETGNPYHFFLFGWSYQAVWGSLGGGDDPVYNVQWAGSSSNSAIDGNRRWGLDTDDYALTENRFCVQYYLDQVDTVNTYMRNHGWDSKFIYSSIPPDGHAGTELGFQRELKNTYLRNNIGNSASSTAYFFDYADILVHNNEGELHTADWNDEEEIRIHQQIHPDNLMDYDENFNIIPAESNEIEDHIGEVGNVRLAKAMWWLLARASGWDGTIDGSDTTSPSTPSGLVATNSSEVSVALFWNASTDNVGVSGYRIYRSGNLIGNTSSLNYTDNSVAACTDYTYTVSAFDAAGNESSQSIGVNVNTTIQAPEATLTQPGCTVQTGTIEITSPTGTGIEYSIDGGSSWLSSATFSGLAPVTAYTISVRNSNADPGCINSAEFVMDAIPTPPTPPVVSNSSPVNECPAISIDLSGLVTSSTPTGGAVLYKTSDDPQGTDVSDPSAVGNGNYYIFYQGQEGCYSTGTEVVVNIDPCPPDITPTLTVSPNIMHGTTTFNLFVRVTELNAINTSGSIVVNIPKDPKWTLPEGFQPLLTNLDGTPLNNSDWSYSSDDTNHIFTSANPIPAGSYSVIGVRISFSPDHSRGSDTVTAQIVSGGGGEVRVSNNSDSERLDYFQE